MGMRLTFSFQFRSEIQLIFGKFKKKVCSSSTLTQLLISYTKDQLVHSLSDMYLAGNKGFQNIKHLFRGLGRCNPTISTIHWNEEVNERNGEDNGKMVIFEN